MTKTPTTAPNEAPKGLTPDGLANQLFDLAIQQNMKDPREAARLVIEFLTSSLFYAVTSSKNDVIVFLTETLIYMVSSSSSGDEAARKELLKHVGDTIANAPPIPMPASNKPAAPASNKPASNKP